MVHMPIMFSRLYARISPSRIHFLRFILEGYDGLAVLSTINAKTGVVLLRFSQEVKNDVVALLEDMAETLTKENYLR